MEKLNTGVCLRSRIDPPGEMLPLPKLDILDVIGHFKGNKKNGGTYFSSIPYFQMPTMLPLDLNSYPLSSSETQKGEKQINQIMQFISRHQEKFLCEKNSLRDYEFITIRGYLRLLMSTPNKPEEDWCIHATRFRGSIYLNEKDTTKKLESNFNQNEDRKRFRKYGHVFKKLCLKTDSTDDEPNEDHLFQLLSMELQGVKMLVCAHIDGLIECENSDKLQLVSLKCSKYNCNLVEKYRQWWCQNFLTGIEDLYVGFHDGNGFVKDIEHFEVSQLPAKSKRAWNPSQCIDFLMRVLNMIKDKMKHVNCSQTVYEFYYDPESKIVKYQVYEGKNDHTFLTDEYVALFEDK